MLFWNSLAFSMIQQMLAIWSLVPLPFLKPAWTSESSRFTYCWSMAWRILSITLPACNYECNCAVVWAFFGIAFLWDSLPSEPSGKPFKAIVYSKYEAASQVDCYLLRIFAATPTLPFPDALPYRKSILPTPPMLELNMTSFPNEKWCTSYPKAVKPIEFLTVFFLSQKVNTPQRGLASTAQVQEWRGHGAELNNEQVRWVRNNPVWLRLPVMQHDLV